MKNKVITFALVRRPSFCPLLVQFVLFEVLFNFDLVLLTLRFGHVIHRRSDVAFAVSYAGLTLVSQIYPNGTISLNKDRRLQLLHCPRGHCGLIKKRYCDIFFPPRISPRRLPFPK